MPRRIRTVAYQADGSGRPIDSYFDRVVKYIPSDVVGAWVAAKGIIGSPGANNPNASTVQWIAFAVGVAITASWTWTQTKEPGKPPALTQVAISTLAFIVWVAALGGPFATLPGYRESYGALLLIGFSLAVGIITPRQ